MYEPNSENLQMASEAAERLIGFYPQILASDPKVYAAGLVQLFSRYPEHLVAEAIDPVDGLPGECDFLPTITKVKAFQLLNRFALRSSMYVVTRWFARLKI